METQVPQKASSAAAREGEGEGTVVRKKLHGWEFWESIGSPKYVCAPMVDGSELPFRMLTRKYGVTLTYTPMFHSKNFSQDPTYRKEAFTTCAEDKPLFVQFCANDPRVLLEAARHVENRCDAVDINFGCPQHIARRGHYGAFLLEDTRLVCSLVRVLHENLSIPVTAKIRLLPDIQHTIELAKQIQEAGASVLAVHGRTKEQKKQLAGLADWDKIKAIREAIDIPLISNGNIRDMNDVNACFDKIGCQGVMSAESLLANPALFSGLDPYPSALDLSLEYLSFVERYPVLPTYIKGHMFWQLNPTGMLADHMDIREKLSASKTIVDTTAAVKELKYRIENNIKGKQWTEEEKKQQRLLKKKRKAEKREAYLKKMGIREANEARKLARLQAEAEANGAKQKTTNSVGDGSQAEDSTRWDEGTSIGQADEGQDASLQG